MFSMTCVSYLVEASNSPRAGSTTCFRRLQRMIGVAWLLHYSLVMNTTKGKTMKTKTETITLNVERIPVYADSGAGSGRITRKTFIVVERLDDGSVVLKDTMRCSAGYRRSFRMTSDGSYVWAAAPAPLRYAVHPS